MKKILFIIFILINTVYAQNWIQRGSLTGIGNWPSVSLADINTVVVAGGTTSPVIFRSTDGGINYTQLGTSGLPGTGYFISCVFALDANTIYAGTGNTNGNIVDNASVYKTNNGGVNWVRVVGTGSGVQGFINGVYFNKSNPQYGFVHSDGQIVNAGTFKIWTTNTGGAIWNLDSVVAPNSQGAQHSLFYIDQNFFGFGLTTVTHRVCMTTDGGASWNFYTLTGAQGSQGFVSTIAFASDKLNGLAASSQTTNTIARTTNGGINWFAQTIPNSSTGFANLAYVPGTPVAYLTVSGSGNAACYKSTNYGTNWTTILYPAGTGNIYHLDATSTVSAGDAGITFNAISVSSSGPTYYLSDIPLPVSLMSFTCISNGKDVNLKWVTSNENNNSGFEIYRYERDNSWTLIGFVEGKGNAAGQTVYTYTDKNLNPGKYTYRLKQIDYNGNYEYYNLNSYAEIGVPKKYALYQNYPNPFNPGTKISFDLPKEDFVSLKIYDNSGKQVDIITQGLMSAGNHILEYKSLLPSGVYFYNLKTAEYSETKKMMIIK